MPAQWSRVIRIFWNHSLCSRSTLRSTLSIWYLVCSLPLVYVLRCWGGQLLRFVTSTAIFGLFICSLTHAAMEAVRKRMRQVGSSRSKNHESWREIHLAYYVHVHDTKGVKAEDERGYSTSKMEAEHHVAWGAVSCGPPWSCVWRGHVRETPFVRRPH